MHRSLAWRAELGDFDPASTIAFAWPANLCRAQQLIRLTFERYKASSSIDATVARLGKGLPPAAHGGNARALGWRERAQQCSHSSWRPAAWNQWAEVVGRDPRKPRFVGDMPHAWIASDFIRSVLDMFAYERNDDHALVLAAGVPAAWLEGDGIRLSGLHTPFGRLSYSMRKSKDRLLLHVDGGIRLPPGGIVLVWHDGEVRITKLPADVAVDLSKRTSWNTVTND
jgi:hypothetical protein